MPRHQQASKAKRKTSKTASDDSSSDEGKPGPSSRTPKRTKSTPKKSGSAKRKPATPSKKVAKAPRARRYRPTQKALMEIRELQRSTKLCIRKQGFGRLVREIQHRLNPRITHWQSNAIQALQEASEAYLVRFLEDCNMAAAFARRVTVMQKDMQFIRRIRGNFSGD